MNMSATVSVSDDKRAWSYYAFLAGPTYTLTEPLTDTDIRKADSHVDSLRCDVARSICIDFSIPDQT